VTRSFELKAIAALTAALAATAAIASCSRAADDCQLNVTCPGDGTKTGSGGQGGSGGAGGATSTSDGATTGTGGGGMTGCQVGELSSCYDGPTATKNVGACKAGVHTCQADGISHSACMNQVLPSAENCLQPADEDCDGKAPSCTGTTLVGASFGAAITDEVVFAVAVDAAGNRFLGGVSGATPPAGAGFAMSSGAGGITKILADGTTSWIAPMKSAVASGYSVVRGLATDQQGNVLVVGEFAGTTSGGAINVVGAGGVDIFLAKLDPFGKTLWAKSFGNAADQFGYSVAVDAKGNVFITGKIVGSVDFGGGAPGVSAGVGDNLFVAKLDPNGKHLWSKAFGDDNPQTGYGVAATPEGDVVVTGELSGFIDFGGGISLSSAGQTDIFVARLAGGDGATTWAHRYGDAQSQTGNGVAVSANGSIVVTGGMAGKCNFGGGDLDAKAKSNVFVAKLHADGSHSWSHTYGSDLDNQVGFGVAVDPAQNILVVGYLKGTLTFGATTLTDASMPNLPNTDMFVAKLSADGVAVWARSFGDVNDQTAWAVAADSASNVLFGGTYTGTVNLPPTITSTGNYDGFWALLAP
jgi:hypothetical protein